MSSVKLKNQLKIYFKQAFDPYLDLPQALKTNVRNRFSTPTKESIPCDGDGKRK